MNNRRKNLILVGIAVLDTLFLSMASGHLGMWIPAGGRPENKCSKIKCMTNSRPSWPNMFIKRSAPLRSVLLLLLHAKTMHYVSESRLWQGFAICVLRPNTPNFDNMAQAPSIDVLLNLVPERPNVVLEKLQAHPALADRRDGHGYSLVHAAASYGHSELLQALVKDFDDLRHCILHSLQVSYSVCFEVHRNATEGTHCCDPDFEAFRVFQALLEDANDLRKVFVEGDV